ncbi:MAG: 2,3-diaminopropionate biosynthesis protein SbnA [Bacteroidota bacterium]
MALADYPSSPPTLQASCHSVLETVGNTPMITLEMEDFPHLQIYSKLEALNPTGSVKARGACFILNKELDNGRINQQTTIIESSSGNFGLALAAYCKKLSLKFICVVDPLISPYNKMLIQQYGATIEQVHHPDKNGGYLLNRIARVKELMGEIDNSYWVNQYGNVLNANGYYHTLGREICAEVDHLDYAFLGVSSGGTITGISRRLKESFPQIQVIAVDIVGSVIFGDRPRKRYIPGIGSSMVPSIIQHACIDDFIRIKETDTILGCIELIRRHQLFLGGSSGSVFAAIKNYFTQYPNPRPLNVLVLFPDGGEKYVDTVYNERWCKDTFGEDFAYPPL